MQNTIFCYFGPFWAGLDANMTLLDADRHNFLKKCFSYIKVNITIFKICPMHGAHNGGSQNGPHRVQNCGGWGYGVKCVIFSKYKVYLVI